MEEFIEIFEPIKGYDDYEVSDCGRVISKKNGKLRVLKPRKSSPGYNQVYLYKDGERNMVQVSRLLAQAFLPNPENLPYVNHKNRKRDDDRLENLEWCSHSYNMKWQNISFKKHTKPMKNKASKLPVGIYETGSGKYIAQCFDVMLKRNLNGTSRETVDEAMLDYERLQYEIQARREEYLKQIGH